MRVPKLLLPAPKNWILGPKTAKFGPKLAFWAKYRHFCPIWSKAWPKNDANKLSRWFSVMLVPKLLLTPIKIRIFGPKTAKIGPKYAFLVIFVHCWLIWCPVGELAGGCGAGCILQDTYLLLCRWFSFWGLKMKVWSHRVLSKKLQEISALHKPAHISGSHSSRPPSS